MQAVCEKHISLKYGLTLNTCVIETWTFSTHTQKMVKNRKQAIKIKKIQERPGKIVQKQQETYLYLLT